MMSERIARNMRNDLFESVINKDVSFFDERRTGDLVSRLDSDIASIQDGLSTNVSMFLRGLFSIIGILTLMFYTSWMLTLATLATVVPLMLFFAFVGSRLKTLQEKI